MSIIWCHDLMDRSQIMLSVTQGVTCGALTFEYALYILRKQKLHLAIISNPRFTTPRFTTPRFTTPRFTNPHFTTPRFTTPRFTTPRFN